MRNIIYRHAIASVPSYVLTCPFAAACKAVRAELLSLQVDTGCAIKAHLMQAFLNTFTNESPINIFQHQASIVRVEVDRYDAEYSFDVLQLAKFAKQFPRTRMYFASVHQTCRGYATDLGRLIHSICLARPSSAIYLRHRGL